MTTAPFYTKALLLTNDSDLPYAISTTGANTGTTQISTDYQIRCAKVGDFAMISLPASTTFTASTAADVVITTILPEFRPLNAPAYASAVMSVASVNTLVVAELAADGTLTLTNSATLSGTCQLLPNVLIFELS